MLGVKEEVRAQAALAPLVVDLDGTLVRTDLLVESFLGLVGSKPLDALRSMSAIRGGRGALKARIAGAAAFDVSGLPFNRDVLAFIEAERATGRPIYLASASDQQLVTKVAQHLGIFDGAFGSRAGLNLAGAKKAQVLCDMFGEKAFDYVGNAGADLAVWSRCRRAYAVEPSASLQRRSAAEAIGSRDAGFAPLMKAMRPHQWLKNFLLFLPVLAAHAFDARLGQAGLAFLSFCLCASSVYLLNDLLDLANDRAHARKRARPFASGALPLLHGIAAIPLLLAAALAISLLLPTPFTVVLIGYFGLTLAYSLRLKRYAVTDVMALACLYGARVVAGGAATGVALSLWLEALSMFLFLSLALVKRCTELRDGIVAGQDRMPGRGYQADDLPMLETMATSSGYLAVLVLALYMSSDTVSALYAHPHRLLGTCVVMLFWINWILIKMRRGEMHDDPLVFAVTDRTSQICGLVLAAVVAASL